MSADKRQQIYISEAGKDGLWNFAKSHPRRHRWRLLKNIFADAVTSLLNEREERGSIDYLAGPMQGPGDLPLNVALPQDVMDRVAKVADDDGISRRRVIYTAVIRFARENEIPM